MRIVLVVLAAALVGLLAPATADACSCRAPGPPCAELFRSTVFVGKVTKVVSAKARDTTTFEVVETLHSAFPLPKSVTINHGSEGNMCGMSFAQGKTYVVYAGGTSPTTLGVGRCSRTHAWTKDDRDVAFAHAASTRTEALVEGYVGVMGGDEPTPKSGIEIRAGGTKVSAKSNAAGKFSFSVPPGSYKLEVVNPEFRMWRGEAVSIDVPVAAACAMPSLSVSYDGRIEGTVTDAAGKPVANLEVHAFAKREADRHWRLSANTDANGHYLIHEVPAGTHLVGVSLPDYGGTGPMSPYPTTYYPGTPALAKAKLLATKQAGLVSKIDFVVPVALSVATLRGVVRHKDGKPAAGATLSLVPAGRTRSTGMAADASGAYSMRELVGEDVVLKACFGGKCAEDKRKVTADAVIDLTLP